MDNEVAIARILIPADIIFKIVGGLRSCFAVGYPSLLRFLFSRLLFALKLLEAAGPIDGIQTKQAIVNVVCHNFRNRMFLQVG